MNSAKYETSISSWVYETPEAVTAREAELDTTFAELKAAAAHKREVLDDDLAREYSLVPDECVVEKALAEQLGVDSAGAL